MRTSQSTGQTTEKLPNVMDCRSGTEGMACCPFHDDHMPSMKLYDDHFHCFELPADRRIDLTAQLTGLISYDTTRSLAEDFGISIPKERAAPPIPYSKKRMPHHKTQQFKEDERLCFSVLADYLHLMWDWKDRPA